MSDPRKVNAFKPELSATDSQTITSSADPSFNNQSSVWTESSLINDDTDFSGSKSTESKSAQDPERQSSYDRIVIPPDAQSSLLADKEGADQLDLEIRGLAPPSKAPPTPKFPRQENTVGAALLLGLKQLQGAGTAFPTDKHKKISPVSSDYVQFGDRTGNTSSDTDNWRSQNADAQRSQRPLGLQMTFDEMRNLSADEMSDMVRRRAFESFFPGDRQPSENSQDTLDSTYRRFLQEMHNDRFGSDFDSSEYRHAFDSMSSHYDPAPQIDKPTAMMSAPQTRRVIRDISAPLPGMSAPGMEDPLWVRYPDYSPEVFMREPQHRLSFIHYLESLTSRLPPS